ncbi:MAG: hypothetical protein KDB53_08730, partial [Planctomycetes bacterium]|nr:hypothetical protein [Planctomycetota bacterium]
TIWWNGTATTLEIDLGGVHYLDSGIAQGDDNDAYLLQYHRLSDDTWQTLWNIPNYDPFGAGMQTRPNPSNDGERFYFGTPVSTDRVRVKAVSGDGAYSLSELQVFVTAPTDLGVCPISVQPAAAAVGMPSTLETIVTNHGVGDAMADLTFFLGDPNSGGSIIGQSQAVIPHASQVPFQAIWSPALPGAATIVARVTSLGSVDINPLNDRATRTVFVGAAPEALAVEAGEVTAWPGATVQTPITIQNVGAASVTITALGSPSPWLTIPQTLVGSTLFPGQTSSVLVDLAVPPGVVGGTVGQAPVVVPLPITVLTANTMATDDLAVNLFDQPVAAVTIEVLDANTSQPIVGANVAVSGLPGDFASDGNGLVVVDLPEGPRGFFAYRPGYVAQAISADVVVGGPPVTILLDPGQTLQVSQISQVQLTTAEIMARGINVNDPVNNVIVDFTVVLNVGPPIVLPNQEIPSNPAPGAVYSVGGICSCGGQSVAVSGTFVPNAYGETQSWILIPGSAMALKQFFEVTAYVVNNAVAPLPQDVQI